ncbi:putative reverse transcriptase domain-containing protein, partial [Tanacetum coccineum]
MDEAHKTKYSVYPGADKMCHDIRDMYWWPGNEEGYCCDSITMDFITKLPRTRSGYDAIWVIVDRLTKSAHFLAIREDYNMEKLARLYIDEVVAKIRDHVMLKVSPWKGVIRFGKKDKLAPRYVRPFEILKRIDLVAYRLKLLEEFSGIPDMFHVSNLKKCLADASLHVPLNEIKVDKTLRFIEEPIKNSGREVMSLRCSRMVIVKVRLGWKRGLWEK